MFYINPKPKATGRSVSVEETINMKDKALYFVFGAFVSGILTWMGSYSHFTGRLEYIRVEQQVLALQSRKVIECAPTSVDVGGVFTPGMHCVEEIQPLIQGNK